jgi:tryptophanyl-tRNA synthetase
VLMAADILVYDADRVPVGEDQRQHLELTRDLALRFNARYGETFVVPVAGVPTVGARIMDLQHPSDKMSKSTASPLGTIDLLDGEEAVTRKIQRAVTDTDGEVRYDPETKPGLANLLVLLAAATDRSPAEVASGYTQYGPLKKDCAEALIELLRPLSSRYLELSKDPAEIARLLGEGADKARAVASVTLSRASRAMGLAPRSRLS